MYLDKGFYIAKLEVHTTMWGEEKTIPVVSQNSIQSGTPLQKLPPKPFLEA